MTRIGVEVTPAAKLDSGDAWSLASLGYGREVRARKLSLSKLSHAHTHRVHDPVGR